MAVHLHLITRRLLPFILFRSLGQLAFWLATFAAYAAIASIFLNKGQLVASVVGGAIFSFIAWIPLLPYELRINAPDTRASLVRITAFLIKSNFARIDGGVSEELGVGAWATPLPWWRKYKGNDVEVSIDGRVVVVRGPRSMIKPLWRNFRGPWREVLDPT
jgi:hypothetical protein